MRGSCCGNILRRMVLKTLINGDYQFTTVYYTPTQFYIDFVYCSHIVRRKMDNKTMSYRD